MPAKTVWPASARARAVRAPKPLPAPLMTMTWGDVVGLLMRVTFWVVWCRGGGRGGLRGAWASGDAAVDVQHLAVDPPTGSGEERDDLRDVRRQAQPLQRGRLGEVLDRGLVLAV